VLVQREAEGALEIHLADDARSTFDALDTHWQQWIAEFFKRIASPMWH